MGIITPVITTLTRITVPAIQSGWETTGTTIVVTVNIITLHPGTAVTSTKAAANIFPGWAVIKAPVVSPVENIEAADTAKTTKVRAVKAVGARAGAIKAAVPGCVNSTFNFSDKAFLSGAPFFMGVGVLLLRVCPLEIIF